MINSLWVSFLTLIPLIPSLFFKSCVLELPPHSSQNRPSWISNTSHNLWHHLGRKFVVEAQNKRTKIHETLASEKKRLQITSELFEPDESEVRMTGTYGQLPEVHVDRNYGAIFPVPISKPNRFSWYQICLEIRWVLRELGKIEKDLEKWNSLNDKNKISQFDSLASKWIEINIKFVSVVQKVRYLEAWIPQFQLLNDSPGEQIIRAFFQNDPKMLASLREILRPHRVIKHPFLPDSLEDVPAGMIELPISTDISDKKFLAEVEGALDTFWNQSFWAKSNQVSFHIQWKLIKKNASFTLGSETLTQHLAHFPKNRAAMTTGGLTTHVKGNALVFGPGRIHPRTLAHELGHLLGFSDCYLRTLSGQGIFGLAILEWDNPFYPDDLMCDNTVGEASFEVW